MLSYGALIGFALGAGFLNALITRWSVRRLFSAERRLERTCRTWGVFVWVRDSDQ